LPVLIGVTVLVIVSYLIMQKRARLREGELVWTQVADSRYPNVHAELRKQPLDDSLLRSWALHPDPDQAYICSFRSGDRTVTTFRFSAESFYPGFVGGKILPPTDDSPFDRSVYPVQVTFQLGDKNVHGGTDTRRRSIWHVLP
jgi:hypothetical protein